MRYTACLRAVVRPCLLLSSAAFVVLAPFPAFPAPPPHTTSLPTPQPPTHPPPQVAPPTKSKPDPLIEASKALRNATKPAEARALERQVETLRQRGLTASTRLLLENADSSLKAHDYRKAEAALDNALVLQPDKAFIRRGRARVRYAAGDFEGAISDLGVALHLDPDDPLSWQLLSQIEEERHNMRAALQAAQQVLVVDPLASGAAKRVKTLQASLDGRAI
ncbi:MULTISPECIES: tetratricopeptide repeat protein [unclassified Asaia]|uniref:tetratricopeptide repeat protein n=1 Tax=unclassified Asaia TaxID=2685023 RepID=UPI001F2EDB0E|nr:tetratricopeptide repeat protein [Asaia sp. W19]